jgi:hypothetical protein
MSIYYNPLLVPVNVTILQSGIKVSVQFCTKEAMTNALTQTQTSTTREDNTNMLVEGTTYMQGKM